MSGECVMAYLNTLAFYIFVTECSFLLVNWPMYFSGSGKLQSLRKPFILPDDESESPAWGGRGANRAQIKPWYISSVWYLEVLPLLFNLEKWVTLYQELVWLVCSEGAADIGKFGFGQVQLSYYPFGDLVWWLRSNFDRIQKTHQTKSH